MIIEFIGTPGAGKTTLLPTVAEFLKEQGIDAQSVIEAARPYARRTWPGRAIARLAPARLQRPLLWQLSFYLSLWHRLLFCLSHPRLIKQVLASQLWRPIPAEARHHALHWFFHLIGYYHFLKANQRANEALVLDEGFVHRVVQMNASEVEEPDASRISAYVNLVPRPDLVIAVHAPWQLCLERIYRRGLWQRFHAKSREDVAAYVQNSHRIVNLTVDQLRSAGWPLIELDNSDDHSAPPQAELRSKLSRIWPTLHSHQVTAREELQPELSHSEALHNEALQGEALQG